jgi:hypothetical protein
VHQTGLLRLVITISPIGAKAPGLKRPSEVLKKVLLRVVRVRMAKKPLSVVKGIKKVVVRHCFAYIGPPNGPIQRPNPVRYVRYGCYETTAGSETRIIGPCATRALPRLKNMALKVVKMGT